MRHVLAKLALFGPVLAISAGASAVNASSDQRALSLEVIETSDSVEVHVVANSPVTQQVEFTAELTGASNARHKGSTSVASGNRQVLSRMKTNTGESWCAKVMVKEAGGANYTLTAGDCDLI
ncbi:hypothetical protein [uncultured Erythrobacter sp.]|uniref:hypothetical protein n=1 Tax=uncultured Erythrobacter sp. TaxID=263913 RepID=UPI00263340C1|nr:hypothetical protein [uncultured Erythrobacter sp.]